MFGFNWLKQELEYWRALYGARTQILRHTSSALRARADADERMARAVERRAVAAETLSILSAQRFALEYPEPDEPGPETWRDRFQAWLASEDSDHLSPRDRQEVDWAIERLQGRSKSSGDEADARRLLTQYLVPKPCWPPTKA